MVTELVKEQSSLRHIQLFIDTDKGLPAVLLVVLVDHWVIRQRRTTGLEKGNCREYTMMLFE